MFRFASDAEIALFWAIGFAVIALIAAYADRRRGNRVAVDRVGFVPWMGIFVGSAFISAALGILAIKGLLAG